MSTDEYIFLEDLNAYCSNIGLDSDVNVLVEYHRSSNTSPYFIERRLGHER